MTIDNNCSVQQKAGVVTFISRIQAQHMKMTHRGYLCSRRRSLYATFNLQEKFPYDEKALIVLVVLVASELDVKISGVGEEVRNR